MENHFHFVLYKGTEILSIAHVEYINNMEAAIRSLATDKIYQRHGFAKVLMQLIERWLKYHDKNTIRLHASLKSEGFYRKLGYTDMPFNDQPLTNKVIDLGKTL